MTIRTNTTLLSLNHLFYDYLPLYRTECRNFSVGEECVDYCSMTALLSAARRSPLSIVQCICIRPGLEKHDRNSVLSAFSSKM